MVTIRPPMQHVPDEVVFGGAQSDPAERLYNAEQMAAAIARARRAGAAEERERCAKVVDAMIKEVRAKIERARYPPPMSAAPFEVLANQIRALPDGD